jgi:nucleotide-binding universal stress UspA family protein
VKIFLKILRPVIGDRNASFNSREGVSPTTDVFSRVLVPIDFSEASDLALDLGARLVSDGGELTVLHVLPATPLDVDSELRRRERLASERTAAAADQLGILREDQADVAPSRRSFEGPFADDTLRDFSEEGRAWAHELDSWAQRHRPVHGHVRTMLRVGDPPEEIVKTAHDADVVVVSLHRHGKLHDWLVDSVPDRLLKLAPCAVLSVPSHEEPHA